jgi:hypothetical protein
MRKRFCAICGAEADPTHVFCNHCGARLVTADMLAYLAAGITGKDPGYAVVGKHQNHTRHMDPQDGSGLPPAIPAQFPGSAPSPQDAGAGKSVETALDHATEAPMETSPFAYVWAAILAITLILTLAGKVYW